MSIVVRNPIIVAQAVTKAFKVGATMHKVLHDINLEIFSSDFTLLYGASGSGKSTLLNTLIGLEPISEGRIFVDRKRIDHLDEDDRAALRAHYIGYVQQQSLWIKSLSIAENVALPAMIAGYGQQKALRRARETLYMVNMIDFEHFRPTEISGGQQQRVALARSLVLDPKILVLDEPTGNLDTHSADDVMKLLLSLNRDHNHTIIMVTHNLPYIQYATRTIGIRDGYIDKIETVAQDVVQATGGKMILGGAR